MVLPPSIHPPKVRQAWSSEDEQEKSNSTCGLGWCGCTHLARELRIVVSSGTLEVLLMARDSSSWPGNTLGSFCMAPICITFLPVRTSPACSCMEIGLQRWATTRQRGEGESTLSLRMDPLLVSPFGFQHVLGQTLTFLREQACHGRLSMVHELALGRPR